MADQPSLGALIGTSISGQALGGALAVVWLAYNPVHATANGMSAQSIEDALTIIFSTSVSVLGMLVHVVAVFLWQKYANPKT